jgi:hypothetical protein
MRRPWPPPGAHRAPDKVSREGSSYILLSATGAQTSPGRAGTDPGPRPIGQYESDEMTSPPLRVPSAQYVL